MRVEANVVLFVDLLRHGMSPTEICIVVDKVGGDKRPSSLSEVCSMLPRDAMVWSVHAPGDPIQAASFAETLKRRLSYTNLRTDKRQYLAYIFLGCILFYLVSTSRGKINAQST